MRPLLLDLFCGAGGAAMGYHRAGFDVVGVDIKPQPNYPFDFIEGDALRYLREWLDERWFCPAQAIHASPPCQAYVAPNRGRETKWPRLIAPIREMLAAAGLPYVIENVPGAPLVNPVQLCGTAFGLPMRRHRLFEASVALWSTPCFHWGTVAHGVFAGVYAFGGKGPRHGRNDRGELVREPRNRPGPSWDDAMGIDWMTWDELREAIPPAYTQFIGEQLLEHLKVTA